MAASGLSLLASGVAKLAIGASDLSEYLHLYYDALGRVHTELDILSAEVKIISKTFEQLAKGLVQEETDRVCTQKYYEVIDLYATRTAERLNEFHDALDDVVDVFKASDSGPNLLVFRSSDNLFWPLSSQRTEYLRADLIANQLYMVCFVKLMTYERHAKAAKTSEEERKDWEAEKQELDLLFFEAEIATRRFSVCQDRYSMYKQRRYGDRTSTRPPCRCNEASQTKVGSSRLPTIEEDPPEETQSPEELLDKETQSVDLTLDGKPVPERECGMIAPPTRDLSMADIEDVRYGRKVQQLWTIRRYNRGPGRPLTWLRAEAVCSSLTTKQLRSRFWNTSRLLSGHRDITHDWDRLTADQERLIALLRQIKANRLDIEQTTIESEAGARVIYYGSWELAKVTVKPFRARAEQIETISVLLYFNPKGSWRKQQAAKERAEERAEEDGEGLQHHCSTDLADYYLNHFAIAGSGCDICPEP